MTRKRVFSSENMGRWGILQGWEAIGRHIGRSGRTARRWSEGGLPVRHTYTGRPFAFVFEIDKWMFLVDESIRKKGSSRREYDQEHAAYMRSCKKRK